MKPIEILILDFDGTLVRTSTGGRTAKDLLSADILALCESRKNDQPFEYFYVCTARDAKKYPRYLLQYAQSSDLDSSVGKKPLTISHDDKEHLAEENVLFSGFMTLSIQTFMEVTNLNFIHASMADDTTSEEDMKCGDTFINHIIPYEKSALLSLNHKTKTIILPPVITAPTTNRIYVDKVDQIQQIIEDALERFQDRELNFTFIDDMRQHCDDAASYFNAIDRVTMKVKWIRANGLIDIAPIDLDSRPSSPALSAGLFSMQANTPNLTLVYSISVGTDVVASSFATIETHEHLANEMRSAKQHKQLLLSREETPITLQVKLKGKLGDVEFNFETDCFDACDTHIQTILSPQKALSTTSPSM